MRGVGDTADDICRRVFFARPSSGWKRLTVTRGVSSPGRRSSSTVIRPQLPDLAAASSSRAGLVVEGGGFILAAGIGMRRHHVAAAPWPTCASARPRPARPSSPTTGRRRPARHRGEFGEAPHLVRGEQMPLGIDRMGGEIEAEGVALGRHPLGQRPARVARQADRGDAGLGRRRRTGRPARWSAGRAPRRHGRGSSRPRRRPPARSGLSASNAPAPARLSSWRRLSSLGSIRSAKSSRS